MKERIEYIDVAKGILIMCLLYGHSYIYGNMVGVDEEAMHLLGKTFKIYGCFFMQAFFLITGFCSSFDQSFGKYLWKCLKTILIPGMLLSFLGSSLWNIGWGNWYLITRSFINLSNWFITGGEWFIVALFWAKIFMWFILKASQKVQIIVVISAYLLGILLHTFNWFPEYLKHQHTFVLLPYLYLGILAKGHMEQIEKYIKPVAVVGIITILVENLLAIKGIWRIPSQDASIELTFINFPIQFFNVLGGTAFVLWLSKKMIGYTFFKTLGMGSLLVYLWNGQVLMFYAILLLHVGFHPHDRYIGFLFYMVVITFSCISFYFLIRIVYRNKYLKWIVGKY